MSPRTAVVLSTVVYALGIERAISVGASGDYDAAGGALLVVAGLVTAIGAKTMPASPLVARWLFDSEFLLIPFFAYHIYDCSYPVEVWINLAAMAGVAAAAYTLRTRVGRMLRNEKS